MNARDPQRKTRWLWLPGVVLVFLAPAVTPVDFNREVRPVLSDNCYACHGPDAKNRKAGLRLDLRDAAIKPLKSGETAIVPGQPEQSELVRRIFALDSDDLMPPEQSHKSLTAEQRETLKRWIAEGAEYRGHWAFEPLRKPVMPGDQYSVFSNQSSVSQGSASPSPNTEPPNTEHSSRWPRNPIDHFVLARLAQQKLLPSREAERRILARRLHFDLVGLPPKPEEVEAFVRNASPDAYEKLVDRLLASPNFGERMAIGWLDVVRFADTIGYHSDNPRNIWPYRDYVIRAFNENKPFDRFTREQLAGDLLPNPTQEQRVASGFNRLLLTTEEGGAQPKDYEARQVTDRVRAVGSVWLGLTTGCAQCHDHKYDPFTMRDFYSLGAFFADVKEPAIGRREDGMFVPTVAQARELARHEETVARLRKEFDAPHPELAESFALWEKEQLAALAAVEAKTPQAVEAKLEDEANVDNREKERAQAKDRKPPAKELAKLLRVPAPQRTAKQREQLFALFKEQAPELGKLRQSLAKAEQARAEFEATVPRTLVTERLDEPRTVRVLARGDWMDDSGEVVPPAFPAFLGKSTGDSSLRQLTRLDLANWLLSPEHPLTARVVVNRFWKQFFGVGLSKVLDDFGAQGEAPPNQPLLDWLASEFRDSGWNVKHIIRLMVTSATYRQTSVASRELLERDPENRLLARQSRWRIEAELVRDNALALAGLLDPTIGGPSAKPYQPEGYWENLNFPKREYEASSGASQYRRGLYVWWQRSFLHPSLLAFDAPSREECAADRACSNIPQQALVLLNDPTYVEAARAFAVRILREGEGDENARIAWAWRQALARPPQPKEAATLRALLNKHRAEYAKDKTAAESFLKVGSTPPPADLDAAELAAWTNVARALLNLHEVITRS